jgi:membrane protein implicated in regulation of membrane protease activity
MLHLSFVAAGVIIAIALLPVALDVMPWLLVGALCVAAFSFLVANPEAASGLGIFAAIVVLLRWAYEVWRRRRSNTLAEPAALTSGGADRALQAMAELAPPVRLGLVGTGADLVTTIEALRGMPLVEITVVADPSDHSEGAKLARSLKLPLIKNAMETFRHQVDVVLEVNGDERQYERLLSIKPPGIEVMGVSGGRLLIALLKQAAGNTPPGSGRVSLRRSSNS